MEAQNTKIANLQVFISENCSEHEREIINFYWDFKNGEFVNTPTNVKNTFGISQVKLGKIIREQSELSFFIYCKSCNSYENRIANTRSNYLDLIKVPRRISYSFGFRCDYCIDQQREIAINERKKAHEKLEHKFEQAIEYKSWNNLTNFEREVLSSCIEMNFGPLKKKYCGPLGKESFIKLIIALEKIASQDLIQLIRNSRDNYITDYKYLTKLSEFKEEIKPPKKIKSSHVHTDVDTNELKFKLTINENQYHPDSPLHAGTVTFKERIVIESGVEYIFGLWNRANENLYLTMTPLENLEKAPQTKRISSQPKSIRQVMINYLNSLGAD